MTRDEAIELLQSRIDLIRKDYPDIEDYAEALQMAIEALNLFAGVDKKVSSSCGQENDLISRQDAIDAFTCNGSVFTYGANVCKAIVSRIMTLPTAQPELIEKVAYIRGFEQGRTQGMIDAQGGKK